MPPRPDQFRTVGPRDWTRDIVAIVGTGPSLIGFDFDRLRGIGRVLAVKEAVFDLPFADACVSIDAKWFRRRGPALTDVLVPLYQAADEAWMGHVLPNATFLRYRRGEGLSDDPAELVVHGSSGYSAVNYAYLRGARRVVLLGFDYANRDGAHHYARYEWHGSANLNTRYLPSWAAGYRSMLPQLARAGVTVINANPDSAMDAFLRMTLDDALSVLRRMG
ncbi:MAG: hypothetical protein ACK53W_12690 [Gemmatimonadota bacterium]